MNNNTLKDYFSNINTSDLSHNNFISRTNNYSNNCDSTSSNHLMTIQNREDNPYIPKKINDSAINNNCYKKINNQTTPIPLISQGNSQEKEIYQITIVLNLIKT